MTEAAILFEGVLDWLWRNYADFRFFAECDIVWTVQLRVAQQIREQRLSYRVFNDHPILPGNRRSQCTDLAILDGDARVRVAAEFKYEPSHTRGGIDIWPSKLIPSVVFWGADGVGKDLDRVREYVAEGRAEVAYSVFIDEGGVFRHRPPHLGAEWKDVGPGGSGPSVLWSRVRARK